MVRRLTGRVLQTSLKKRRLFLRPGAWFYVYPEYEEELVATKAARKNIVYLNKPVDIEDFSRALADVLPEINSREVDTAIENISEYLQPQYNLLACLRKGVIYHHGSVPDAIRIYIEDLYKRIPEIKFVVTTSTLLSGVNLPAERMFILDNKKGKGKLRPEAFKNLIGRVCRFSEIFNPSTGGLEMLEPQIHIVFGKYFSANANYMSFIQEVAKADIRIEDKVDNILLENTRVTPENEGELKAAAEFIENYENGVINNYSERYTTTEIGQSCIMTTSNIFFSPSSNINIRILVILIQSTPVLDKQRNHFSIRFIICLPVNHHCIESAGLTVV